MPKRLTQEEFIQKAKLVHGDKYDYSETKYINYSTPVIIFCKTCQKNFKITPRSLLVGQGCRTCGYKKRIDPRQKTTEQFIKEARKFWGDKYDYSKVKYINNSTKVCIICPKHGEFWQTPLNHLQGHECFFCRNDKISQRKTHTNKQFKNIAIKKHGQEYDYSKVNYIDKYTKVCIICPKHGEFWQTPDDHIRGCGCPMCKSSKGEREIARYLKSNGIIFERQKKFDDLRDKALLSFDFYLPEKNILIEYNGEQHYKPINFGNLEKAQKKFHLQKHHDWLKRKYAQKNDLKLLIIPYWKEKEIKNILDEWL